MAPSPFRRAAVVCSVLTASLGFGLLTPAAATAAPSTLATHASTAAAHDLDAITVDPGLSAPRFLQDWSTLHGARIVAGDAGRDAVWLLAGDEVLDHSPAGGAFFLNVQDRHKDLGLEVIRVHTAADGSRTRTERIAMPLMIRVDGLQEQNTFTPGTTHFSGSATAGATVVAKDSTSGATLFTTEVSGARNGTGTWNADADLSDSDHVITLTQTTTDGRTNELRDVRFSPAASDAPTAPTLQTTERRLDGSFVLTGKYDDSVASVAVQDTAGATIADATLEETGYVARIPQDRLGSTVYVVAKAADGTPSSRTAAPLAQLPTDASVPKPTLSSVYVHTDGRVQVVGEPDGAAALWILDGDRVIAGIPRKEIWSYVIRAQETGKQLEIANVGFDGQGFSSLSERVALPRLLQVDGVKDENTYTPGARAFEGTAEAGATITATDQRGRELFKTPVAGARSGVGTWKASADLTSTAGYDLTFTQTTADGRTSVMRNIAFTADEDTASRDLTLTSHQAGTFTPGPQRFTGTATPGATVTFNPAGFDPSNARHNLTTEANSAGVWTIERSLADWQYKDAAFRQDADGDVVKQVKSPLIPEMEDAAPRDLTLTSHQAGTFTPGPQRFTGTATPGATVTFNPAGFDPSNARHDLTTQADSAGVWTIERSLADWQYKDAAFRQDADGDVVK
ncbi:hypothetical protein, partial [Curtobacterium aurantiacum]